MQDMPVSRLNGKFRYLRKEEQVYEGTAFGKTYLFKMQDCETQGRHRVCAKTRVIAAQG
jgi:hypothetical protein